MDATNLCDEQASLCPLVMSVATPENGKSSPKGKQMDLKQGPQELPKQLWATAEQLLQFSSVEI